VRCCINNKACYSKSTVSSSIWDEAVGEVRTYGSTLSTWLTNRPIAHCVFSLSAWLTDKRQCVICGRRYCLRRGRGLTRTKRPADAAARYTDAAASIFILTNEVEPSQKYARQQCVAAEFIVLCRPNSQQ